MLFSDTNPSQNHCTYKSECASANNEEKLLGPFSH